MSSVVPSTSGWRVLGASVTGTSHQKIGRGCEDAYDSCQLQDGTLLLTAADGAGSASYSAEGAAYAIQAALHTAEYLLTQESKPESEEQWHALLRTVLKSVRLTLERLASGEIGLDVAEHNQTQQSEPEKGEQWQKLLDSILDLARATLGLSVVGKTESADKVVQGDSEGEVIPKSTKISLREFATTLLFAAITPHWIAVTQIGDGAVVMQDAERKVHCLTWPDHGEYANEASFVTDADYLNSAQYCILAQEERRSIALFTDGLERLVLNFKTKTAYEPFFTPMFKYATSADATEAELAAFLVSKRVCEHTDDDKTLVLAVPV